jgi:acyl-ACP thioesterase
VPDLVPLPDHGRVFETSRRVRFGDTDGDGRLRLDALARHLQDVGNDDFEDAGLDPSSPWVARRSVVVSPAWPRLGERLEVATWCGGTGSRWAERRSSLRGDAGAVVDIATLWVFLEDGRPGRLPAWFVDTYAAAAAGRVVSSRLSLPPPGDRVESRAWVVRATDLDVLGHVNNAATWSVVEEECLRQGIVPARATLEYGAPLEWGEEVELQTIGEGGQLRLWLLVGGAVRAAASVTASA